MEILKRLGLTGYEIQVYQALLSHGKCAAKDVAGFSGVPPTAVYPNLKSLIAKGLIQQFKGDGSSGSYFEAIPPDVSLPSFVQLQTKQIQFVAEQAIPMLESLKGSAELFPKKQVVALSYGSEASMAVTSHFLNDAKESVYILGWRFRCTKMFRITPEEFRRLRARKIDVRIIVTGMAPKVNEQLRFLEQQGVQMRYYPLDNFSVIVKDMNSCKITLKNQTMDQKLNIRIDDIDLASFLGQYFLSIWQKARPIDFLLKETAERKKMLKGRRC